MDTTQARNDNIYDLGNTPNDYYYSTIESYTSSFDLDTAIDPISYFPSVESFNSTDCVENRARSIAVSMERIGNALFSNVLKTAED